MSEVPQITTEATVTEMPGTCVICESIRTRKKYVGVYVCDSCFNEVRTNPNPDKARDFVNKLNVAVARSSATVVPPSLSAEQRELAVKHQIAGLRFHWLLTLTSSFVQRPEISPPHAVKLALETMKAAEEVALKEWGFQFECQVLAGNLIAVAR